MFLPVYDDNDLISIDFQYITVGLIAANVIVYLIGLVGHYAGMEMSFALIPSDLHQVDYWGGPVPGHFMQVSVPEQYTLIGYMFLHGGFWHLAGNMLFLWVFGDNVEDAMGHMKFLIFYIACGICAGLLHSVMLPASHAPLIGASGAVAGVIAAYLLLHPKVRLWVLVMRVFPLQITAAAALGFWIALQVLMLFVPAAGPIAWWAHIGGLISGALLVIVLRRPGVPLLDGMVARR